MKMFTAFFAMAISFASLASSGESRTFVFDGSQNSVEIILRGEKTHTEYRYEQRRTTCTRTEVDYRTVCDRGGVVVGPNGPVRVPPTCHTQPHYRTVYYPCTQTVSIPYEVKDFDTEARVIIDVRNTGMAVAAEAIRVSLNGDSLSLNVNGSKRYFVTLKKQDIRNHMRGSMKFIDAVYALELVEAAPVLSALALKTISFENSMVKVGLGPITSTDFVGFSLYVEKKKTFSSDEVLFNRELAISEIQFATNNVGSDAAINLRNFGLNLAGGKFGITVRTFFKAPGTLLNGADFSALEASKTLIYTNR